VCGGGCGGGEKTGSPSVGYLNYVSGQQA